MAKLMLKNDCATGAVAIRRSSRGGALVLALVAAVAVAIFAVGVVQLTSTYMRRQLRDEHETRAFYLAEAGLSEAYHGLTTGRTGQIGSEVEPVRSGDGIFWVDSSEQGEGLVRLECTAIAGIGSSTLALTVRRVERPAGIFSVSDLILSDPLLVDGYDSQAAPYEEQVVTSPSVNDSDVLVFGTGGTAGTGSNDDSSDGTGQIVYFKVGDLKRWGYQVDLGTVFYTAGHYYRVVSLSGTSVGAEDLGTSPPDGVSDPSVSIDADSTTLKATSTDVSLTGWATTDSTTSSPSTSEPMTSEPVMSEPVTTTTTAPELGIHTSGSGLLATNGSVRIETPSAVYGDIVHGPDGTVSLAEGSFVSGAITTRSAPLELPPVPLPTLEMAGSLEHSSSVPRVIPPGQAGFEALHVLPGGEVVLRGPSTLLFGRLQVDELGILEVDNLDGRVDLYVTQDVALTLGSTLRVLSTDPALLTLQVAGTGTQVRLASSGRFNGLVYAPERTVVVSSPFELFGALIAGSLSLDGTVRLHFDSGIAGESGPIPIPRLVSWEVSEVPAGARNLSMVEYLRNLGQDGTTLPQPADVQPSDSWIVNFKYRDANNRVCQFDGPFYLMPLGEAVTYLDFWLTDPPATALSAPWTMDLDYDTGAGVRTSYVGTIDGFQSICWDVGDIHRITLTPPAELLDRGWRVTTIARTP